MDDSKMTISLFLGFLLTSELKMHLNKSAEWQNAKLHLADPSSALDPSNALKEVQYGNQTFVGIYLSEPKLSLKDIKKYESQLKMLLNRYCERLECSKLECSLFSQFFIR